MNYEIGKEVAVRLFVETFSAAVLRNEVSAGQAHDFALIALDAGKAFAEEYENSDLGILEEYDRPRR